MNNVDHNDVTNQIKTKRYRKNTGRQYNDRQEVDINTTRDVVILEYYYHCGKEIFTPINNFAIQLCIFHGRKSFSRTAVMFLKKIGFEIEYKPRVVDLPKNLP